MTGQTLRQSATIDRLRRRRGVARLLPFKRSQRGYPPSCPLIGAGTAGRMFRQRQCQRYPCCCQPTLGDSVRDTLNSLLGRLHLNRD